MSDTAECTVHDALPEPGEIRALNGLSWEPWVLVTRVEPDEAGNLVARFAVIDEMDDDVLEPIPDSRFADLEASVGDREWREIIAEQVDENDEIDKRWCPTDRLDVLGKPGIQGCDNEDADEQLDDNLIPDGGESGQAISMPKTWAVVSGDEILLEAETKPELRREMSGVDLPADSEIVALPKAHGTVIV